MADLPMAQIPNFQLGATPDPTAFSRSASQMSSATTQALQVPQELNIQRQQVQAAAALQQAKVQQMQIEKNMKMLEVGSQMILEGGPETQNTGRHLIGQSYLFLTGQPLPEGVILDKPHAKDLAWYMDQYRQYQQSGGAEGLNAKDAVAGVIQGMQNYGLKYRQSQMELLKGTPMYGEATASQEPGQVGGQPASFNPKSGVVTDQGGQPTQGNFVPASTAASTQSENQRAAAAAMSPVFGIAKNYHTAIAALARKDQMGDATAIAEGQKLMGVSQPEMEQLAKSGAFGTRIAQDVQSFLGKGKFADDEQRADFQSSLDLHYQAALKAASQQASNFPGTSVQLPPIVKKLKSGKTAESSDGGRTWHYKP